jgi:hypothetical protein
MDRRPALKAIGAGAGIALAGILPKSWSRPVVQSVVVPAHAATSPLGVRGGDDGTTTTTTTTTTTPSPCTA